jgi:hypothetical protein
MNQVYRFVLIDDGTGTLLVSQKPGKPPDRYYVDLRSLHHGFEKAVADYCAVLDSDSQLQTNFAKIPLSDYGFIDID